VFPQLVFPLPELERLALPMLALQSPWHRNLKMLPMQALLELALLELDIQF
jgi:hypothetical protein